jgi:CRP/FNR family cyclic AMP-dependent transcriptional regulator
VQEDPLWHLANELRDVLPLRWLSEADGWELVSHMRVRRFDEGDVVYHQGDLAGDAFVVHRGLLKSLITTVEGRELLLGLYGRGEFFGTLALFKPSGRRESTIVATAPTTVLQVPAPDALHVLQRNWQAMQFLAGRYVRMIERLSAVIDGLGSLDLRGRLTLWLLELERHADAPFTQQDLAAAVVASRQSVNRILMEFERRGLIEVEPRRVRILDREGLRRELRIVIGPEQWGEFWRRMDDVLFRDT